MPQRTKTDRPPQPAPVAIRPVPASNAATEARASVDRIVALNANLLAAA